MRARGERGSATVELAILLPVYMILFVALLTIGHMVLIKQELVLAVRYQAWLPDDSTAQSTGSINNSFFPDFTNYGGGYATSNKIKQDLDLAQEYANELGQQQTGGSNGALDLAKAVLNDNPQQGQGQRHLQKSAVEGQFTYNPDWLGPFLAQAVHTPTASCTVYLRKQGPERKILNVQGGDANSVSDHNPIEEYTDSNAPTGNPYPISSTPNWFFPPSAPAPQDQGAQVTPAISDSPSPDDPGIWDKQYRIGGSEDQERMYFHQWLYGN